MLGQGGCMTPKLIETEILQEHKWVRECLKGYHMVCSSHNNMFIVVDAVMATGTDIAIAMVMDTTLTTNHTNTILNILPRPGTKTVSFSIGKS